MRHKVDLDDVALLERIQRQTFRYFWDFAHPVSGLVRDRSDPNPNFDPEVVAIGASGFGIMAILVDSGRDWIKRKDAANRLQQMVQFLKQGKPLPRRLSAFPGWRHGRDHSLLPQRRWRRPLETSFSSQACLPQGNTSIATIETKELRAGIDALWDDVEWDWYRAAARSPVLDRSPNGLGLDHEIRGWNECLVTYVFAAWSPRYPIRADAYHWGCAAGRRFSKRQMLWDRLPLGPAFGGPLFFAHYSFLGLDPRGLKDRYANYWEQNLIVRSSIANIALPIPTTSRVWSRVLGAHGERRSTRVSRSCPRQRLGRDRANGGASVLSIYAREFDARVAAFLLRHGEQDLA